MIKKPKHSKSGAFEFIPKSIIGLCSCARPMRIKHTIETPEGEENIVHYLGDWSETCKFCGKPWKEHIK